MNLDFILQWIFPNLKNGTHTLSVFATTSEAEKLIGRTNFELKKNPSESFEIISITKDFRKSGETYFHNYLEKIVELKPDDKVLDVGCSIGRLAMVLRKYLDYRGSYNGLDITPAAINWCKENITPKYSNFHFTLADLYNRSYNRYGKYKASEYKFPYTNISFDFVNLWSVFTHLLEKDLENYVSEISRVLKKGGKCLISFFLLNDESLKLIKENKSTMPFVHELGACRVLRKENPEFAIAYDEDFIRNVYKKNGLEIMEPIYYGNWCGRKTTFTSQDFVFAIKK